MAGIGDPALRELPALQVVDPEISREKFDAEVSAFRGIEEQQRRRGIWLLEASFPSVFTVMVASQLRPAAVVCGVSLDFTNYDFEPPSVRLVDPFTRVPYRTKELPTALLRQQPLAFPPGVMAIPGAQMMAAVPLMQSHQPDDIPFLCVAGVREYHNHPAHTGDSWLRHRGLGSGTLINLLNTIYTYGVQPISEYNVGLRVTGFQQKDAPS